MHVAKAGVNGTNGRSKSNGTKELMRRPFVALTVQSWPDALRYCRVERGFSYADVVRSVCKDRPNDPRSWESGEKTPDSQDLRRLYYALPKLRNYANLLPESVQHPMAQEPTGEAVAPEALAEAAKPHKDMSIAKAKDFGEALQVALNMEGMTHTEFSKIVGMSNSTISAYVANGRMISGKWEKVSMIQATYERILDLLPVLKEAPLPIISERSWNNKPGRKMGEWAKVNGKMKKQEEPELEALPRPMPRLPEGKGMAPPTPAPEPEDKQLELVKFILTPAIIQRATERINQAGAAYGVALATVARLEAELVTARKDVEVSNARMLRAIAVLKGEADPETEFEPS